VEKRESAQENLISKGLENISVLTTHIFKGVKKRGVYHSTPFKF